VKALSRLHLFSAVAAAAAAVGAAAWVADDASAASRSVRTYEVTVTNLTRGQVISPPYVVAHTSKMAPLWNSGEAASAGLAAIAEDADTSILATALDGAEGVLATASGSGPIPPGMSDTVTIEIRGKRTAISLVAMPVQTNDAFVGGQALDLPRRRGQSTVVRSPAYDAGSEANNEDGDFIPGPPFGNGNVRDTAGAEGFVHVHAGVHGIADLDAATYDWRNPTAEIRITRVR
jgi:hypothetical protein